MDEQVTHVSQGQPPDQPKVPAPARRRRRRWPFVVVGLLVLVIAVVAAAPYIASTRPGTRLVASVASRALSGHVAMDNLATSWRGPTRVQNLSIRDALGREVLQVRDIRWQRGVLGAVRDPLDVGTLNVDGAVAVLVRGPDGEVSLFDALQQTRPSDDQRLPEPRGKITLRDGLVRVVPDAGPAQEISVSGHVEMDSLDRLKGQVEFLSGDGTVRAEASLADLVHNGRIDVFNASGTFDVTSDGELDLTQLARLALPDSALAGKGSLHLNGRFDAGRVATRIVADLREIRTERPGGPGVEPIDVSINGQLAGSVEQVSGDLDLAGEAGTVTARFEAVPKAASQPLRREQLAAMILNGQRVALPSVQLRLSGDVDLPALARSVPALLNIRDDVRVTDGRLLLRDVVVRGGESPSASGHVELTQVRGLHEGEQVVLEPMTADFDAGIAYGRGLQIRRADLTSGFAAANGQGVIDDMRIGFESDLGAMRTQLGSIFHMGDRSLAGTLRGEGRMSRAAENRINFDIAVAGAGIRSGAGEEMLQVERGTLNGAGYLVTGGPAVRLVLSSGRVGLDGQVVADAKGWYTFRDGGVRLQAAVSRGNLAYLGARAADLGMTRLAGYGGTFSVDLTAERARASDPVSLAGSVALADLRHGDERLAESEVTVHLVDARYAPGAGRFAANQIRAESPFARATLHDVRYDNAGGMDVRGELEADLQRLLRVAAPAAGWAEAPEIAGRLNWSGTVESQGPVLTIESKGGVQQLAVGAAKADRDQVTDVTFASSGLRYNRATGELGVQQATLDSRYARATLRDARYGRGGALTGQAQVHADIQRVLRTVAPLTEWQETPAVGGRLTWNSAFSSSEGVVTVDGAGQVEQLIIGRGERQVRDPRLELQTRMRLDDRSDLLDIASLRASSQLIQASVKGRIEELRTRRVLDLACEYKTDWQQILALVQEFAPGVGETFTLRGALADRFEVRGPAWTREGEFSARDLSTELRVGWTSGHVIGLDIGNATLPLRLSDGVLSIGPSSMPAAGGTAQLAGQLDLRPEQPILALPAQHTLVRNVRLDAEIGKTLLSRVNPIFGHVSRLEGQAALELNGVRVPLEDPARLASGSGRLALTDVRLQPERFLQLLLEAASTADARIDPGLYAVRASDLPFTIRDGRIRYQDFTMHFARDELDLRFSGSVGLDDTLDLTVSVPVRSALLSRFGVSGPVQQYARALEGVRVDIPIRGTREKPELQLARVDMKPLIAQAVRGTVRDEVGRQIGGLLGEPISPEAGRDAPRDRRRVDPEQTARDALRGIIGGRERDRDRSDDAQRSERRRR